MKRALTLAACSAFLFLLTAPGCAGVDDSGETVAEASSDLSVSDWSTIAEPTVDAYNVPEDQAVATINGTQLVVFRLDTDLYWKKRTATGWTDRASICDGCTVDRVSLAAFNGLLYMLYTDPDTRSVVRMAKFDPATETWSQAIQLSYPGFNGPPAIAAFDHRLFFVGGVKSKTSSTYPMWVGTMSTSEVLTSAQPLGVAHQAASQPSLAVYGSRLIVAHRNGQTGDIVYSGHNQGDAPTIWSPPQTIPAGPFGAALRGVDPSIASVNGYLHLVHRQPNLNDVWWTYFDTCSWAPEVTIGNRTSYDPPSLTAGGAGLVMLTNPLVPGLTYPPQMQATEYHAPPAPITAPSCSVISP